MASLTQNKHATKRLQYKLMCFLVITFVIAYQRKVLQEKVSSFLAAIGQYVILFAFIAFCIKACEQADSSKSRGCKSNQSQQGAQGAGRNHNSGTGRGATSTAYRGQGVGSTYNTHREAGTRATSSSGSTCNGGGAAPNQARNHGKPVPNGPSQPNGFYGGDPYSTFSAGQHAQNLSGLTPELSHLYQQSIDAINRQYHRDMEKIKRQHSYALNQNQLAFEHQHQLYMQQ